MNSKKIITSFLLISLVFIGCHLSLHSVQAQICDDEESYPVQICDDPYPIDMPATSTPRPTRIATVVPQTTPTSTQFPSTPTRILPTSTPTPTRLIRERRIYLPSIGVESNFDELGAAASVHLTAGRVNERNLSLFLWFFLIGISGVTFVYVK